MLRTLETKTCKRLHKPQGIKTTEGATKNVQKESSSSRGTSGYGNSPKTYVNPYHILENNARKRSKLLKKFDVPIK